MPLSFGFDASTLASAPTIDRADFSTGSAPGLDYPSQWSAVAANQSIATSGGVDVFAITLVAGQATTFDIDYAGLDLELDIIDAQGRRVGGSDNANGTRDPFLTFTPAQTGTYFVAVHAASNDYVDGSFGFEGTPGPTGSYQLNVSTAAMPGYRYSLTSANDSFSYSDNAQVVKGAGGNDYLLLNGGDDVGQGGSGNDSVYGGSGRDDLTGGSGNDRLEGGAGDDALKGGSEADRLYGGSERDDLRGGSGNDGLYGGSGDDALWGEAGTDTIFGEDGRDFIRGGEGLDVLYGGEGADTFHFLRGEAPPNDYATEDRIEDFQIGDRIDLSDLWSGTLAWKGSGSFTGAGQVRVVPLDSGFVDVRVNLDSDSASEFEVLVKPVGGFALIADDFIL